MKVTMQDVIAAGYCVTGARVWFKANKLDFRAFMKSGIDADAVPRDPMALRIIQAAKVRHEH